jgi:C-mannosyltransferase DPY19L
LSTQGHFCLSTIFTGVGFAYIHIYHSSESFFVQTNFPYLTKIEKEILFKDDLGLYYFYYKTIVSEVDFDRGMERILRDNLTEYPRTINPIKKYHIYPEILTAFLYTNFMNLSNFLNLSKELCWAIQNRRAGDISDDDVLYACDVLEDPIYFYLSIVWFLSGLTVFLLYIYGTLLSRSMLGGLTSVIYYLISHQDATNVISNPTARENYAYPFLIWQMMYLTLFIDRYKNPADNVYRRNYGLIINLTIFTTCALLFWQFSTFIFASQILVVFVMLQFNMIQAGLVLDYCTSQLLSNLICYCLMFSNVFLTSIHQSMVIGLLIYVTKTKIQRSVEAENNEEENRAVSSYFKRFLNHMFFFVSISCFVATLSERFGSTKMDHQAVDDITSHYIDLAFIKVNFKPPNLISQLYFRNKDLAFIDMTTLKSYHDVFIRKNFLLFLILILERGYQKLNNIEKLVDGDKEHMERAKNYVIEDFLEDNKIRLQDLTNPATEKQIDKCLALLKECNYDYELYKLEKSKARGDKSKEKMTFLSDIKKLKNQINEKEKSANKGDNKDKADEDEPVADSETGVDEKSTPDHQEKEAESDAKETRPNVSLEISTIMEPFHFFNIVQAVFLFIMAVLVYKLKYVFTPILCVLVATLISKNWFSRHTHIYWILYVILISCSIIDPGLKNMMKQMSTPNNTSTNAELLQMIVWIDMFTEKNAVFGGPMELTPQILATTGRPIVNNPHMEYLEMR